MAKLEQSEIEEMQTRIMQITTEADQYIDYGGFDKKKGA